MPPDQINQPAKVKSQSEGRDRPRLDAERLSVVIQEHCLAMANEIERQTGADRTEIASALGGQLMSCGAAFACSAIGAPQHAERVALASANEFQAVADEMTAQESRVHG